jgi:hypothetical protein
VTQQHPLNEEQQPTWDSIGATPEERALGSFDAVLKARAPEKARLLAKPAAPAPRGTNTVDTLLGAFTSKQTEADTRAGEDKRARVAAVVEPLQKAVAQVTGRFGALKRDVEDKAEKIAAMNIDAVRKAVPLVVTPGNEVTNHDLLVIYHRLAVQVRDAFRIQPELGEHFGDLTKAMQWLVNCPGDVGSPAFEQARRHVNEYLQREERAVVGLAGLAQQFKTLGAKVEDMLNKLSPQDVAPTVKAATLPALPAEQPTRTGTSYTDFDPREPLPAKPDSRVEKLEGGGVRINKGGGVEPGLGSRGKQGRVI